MTHIDDAARELQAMGQGTGNARAAVAAAAAAATAIANQAAAAGFHGVAASMSQVARAITDLQPRLSGVGRTIEETATVVGAVPPRPTPEEAKATLGPAKERATTAGQSARAVMQAVDDIRNMATAALRGGQPGNLLAMLQAITRSLEEIVQRAGRAGAHVQRAIDDATRLGDAGNR
jgi:Family of unknown function (DUF6244)